MLFAQDMPFSVPPVPADPIIPAIGTGLLVILAISFMLWCLIRANVARAFARIFAVLAIGVVSNLGEYMTSHGPWFGGMSGVVYGLLGFVWVRMVRHPNEGLRVHQQTIVILMIWLVLGFTEVLRDFFNLNIANYAHLSGLLAGAGIAAALPAWAKKRRKTHQ